MSYITLTPTEVATGEPVTTTVLNKIKSDLDDHEARLLLAESGTNVTYPPLIMRVNGYYPSLLTGVLKTTTNFGITITGIRIIVDVAGTAGTLEIDIKYKRGAGSWTSILGTKPSVVYTAGDDAVSTNAILNASETTLQAGDLIRLDITSGQTAGKSFLVRIDYVGA